MYQRVNNKFLVYLLYKKRQIPIELITLILEMITKQSDLKSYSVLYSTITIEKGDTFSSTNVVDRYLIPTISLDINLQNGYTYKKERYGYSNYTVTYQLSSNIMTFLFYHNDKGALKYSDADKFCKSGTEVSWRLIQKYFPDTNNDLC